MKCLFNTFSAAALTLLCVSGITAQAQQLKLVVDRQSGDMSLTGIDEMAVDFAGYAIQSNLNALNSGNWNGIRDTEPNWVIAGTPSSSFLSELNSSGTPGEGAIINSTLSLSLGSSVYDPAAAAGGVALGEDPEAGSNLTLTYYDQFTDQVEIGAVEFVGEKIFNNIGITVDLADGKAYLENESPNPLTITGYLIESTAGGTLNTNSGTFTGLGSPFQKPSPLDGSNLGELDPTGAGELLASSTAANTLGMDLGVVVDPTMLSTAFEDLSFSFILEGMGESSRSGFVKYINVPAQGIVGDYNGDGTVNLADYTVWRDNLGADESVLQGPGDGSGTVDAGDYTEWKNNFGAPSAPAAFSAATVPEPSALVMGAAACIAGLVAGRRRQRA